MKANQPLNLKKIRTSFDTNTTDDPDSVSSNKNHNSLFIDLDTLTLYKSREDIACPHDLFLPDLTFIDEEDALPGSATLLIDKVLLFYGNKITLLIPINSLLIKYLSVENLIKRLHFSQDSSEVTLTLKLDLEENRGRNVQEHKISKIYNLSEQNAIETVPVIDIWPYISPQRWSNYYAFYYGNDSNTFQVQFDEAEGPHTYPDANGDYLITRLNTLPTYINCLKADRNIGFIPLTTPQVVTSSDIWIVGVDFDSLFTNVYVNQNGNIAPLKLDSLHLKVTDANVETRQPLLFKNFIPEIFLPTDKPLPLATMLTRLGETGDDQKKVLYDGRIFVPCRNEFHPEDNWIETDFAWKDSGITRLFLEHLALIVAAQAANSGIKEIRWSISYPSELRQRDLISYLRIWKYIIYNLNNSTGIKHYLPEIDDAKYLRSRSLAFAQYFADREGCDLIRSVCLNIGDETSDISIWQDNNLIHQCSIYFGGRDLLSQLLKQRPDLIAKWFKQKDDEWLNLKDDDFNSKLDSLLRYESECLLKNERLKLSEDRDFQGLVQLIALGTAGLYYYIGLIVRTLTAEGKCIEGEIPSIYIGGSDCTLFHWLDNCGKFTKRSGINDLLQQMLVDASGLQYNDSNDTQLSQRPKDEVACGLVLNQTRLRGIGSKQKDSLIAGENCRLNGRYVGFFQRMEVNDEEITKIEFPPRFDRLIDFVNSFNQGIKDLEIEDEIKPFSQYSRRDGLDPQYANVLLNKTNRELTSMLLNINNGDGDKLRLEPPFILGLKALMRVLAKEWIDR